MQNSQLTMRDVLISQETFRKSGDKSAMTVQVYHLKPEGLGAIPASNQPQDRQQQEVSRNAG